MNKLMWAVLPLTLATATFADEKIPNLVGTWEGEATSVVMGGGRHHEPGNMTDIRFVTKKFIYVIERQEGRNLVGYITNEGNQFREVFIGSIHPDGTKAIIQDEDGKNQIDLVGENEMVSCYSHSNAESRVSSCLTLFRKP